MSIRVNSGSSAPALHAVEIVPDNYFELDYVTRGIYVGGTGDLAVMMEGGELVTFKAVPVGTLLPICVRAVFDTGTDATYILGLW